VAKPKLNFWDFTDRKKFSTTDYEVKENYKNYSGKVAVATGPSGNETARKVKDSTPCG